MRIALKEVAAVLQQQRPIVNSYKRLKLVLGEALQPLHDLQWSNDCPSDNGRVPFDFDTEPLQDLDGEGTRVLVTPPIRRQNDSATCKPRNNTLASVRLRLPLRS